MSWRFESLQLEPRYTYLGGLVLLFLAYYITAEVGLQADAVNDFATMIWAPTGIALAALLLYGYRFWPAIAAAAFLVNHSAGAPFLVAAGIAAGNTLEAVAATYLLKRYFRFETRLERQTDVLGFVVLACGVSTLISASLGVFSLYLGDVVPFEEIFRTWTAWWIGDALGALVVAPLILTWLSTRWPPLKLECALETLALTLALGLSVYWIFGRSPSNIDRLLPFPIFPIVLWAALRFGQKGSAAAAFAISLAAIWATAKGSGPFAVQGPLSESLPILHSFLGVMSFTGMILAASIAERRRATDELRVAKDMAESANAAKSTFLANMSHEIRTPLGAVLGFAHLVADPEVSANEKQDYVTAIQRNGELLSNIINDILDLSKVEAGKMQVDLRDTDISEILRDTETLLELQASEKGLDLRFHVQENVPKVIRTDALRLRQILINIISNAIKFTSSGSVSVSVSVRTEGAKLCFEVSDTGCGIQLEQVDRLFSPFSQTDAGATRRYGGTGLGLVLSKRLANILGGDVVLTRTAPNEGSVFTITVGSGLPSSTSLTSAKQHSHKAAADGRIDGYEVLLVEDSPDNQVLVSRILSLGGASVQIASNGVDAIQATQKKTYDVILMDLQMPIMDGYAATEKLRAANYKGCIIALTAHAFSEEKNRCLENGFDDYITKPISPKELIERVRQVRV